MVTNFQTTLLNFICQGIGHSIRNNYHSIEWGALHNAAIQQGLSAIVLDGINASFINIKSTSSDNQNKLEWIGEVMQNYEGRFKEYERAIALLAKFYNEHGLKMMVLKGYACSLDWPKPEHRPCGDIDIWLFGKQKEADALFVKEKGIKVDTSHHHHTVFGWNGFTVENHYDFVNIYSRQSSKELEIIFKKLGQDDTHFAEVNGEKVYLPSPNLHALFLIKHMVSHFAAAEITLRQVLDWAFFVEKHTNEIDWKWLVGLLKKYHMKDFYNCINAICVGDLGFDVRLFPSVQFDSVLKGKVLADILSPAYGSAEPHGFVKRMTYKYRRWQGNAWKQRLCYPESRWCAFWMGIWAKLLKPAAI